MVRRGRGPERSAPVLEFRSGSGSISSGNNAQESIRPYSVISVGARPFRVEVAYPVGGYSLAVPREFVSDVFSAPVLPRVGEFLDDLRRPLLRVQLMKAARYDPSGYSIA